MPEPSKKRERLYGEAYRQALARDHQREATPKNRRPAPKPSAMPGAKR
ncbi:hypothetical protein [Streptomyces solincola]|nr:hypothetical protein [Streptomyces solincola]